MSGRLSNLFGVADQWQLSAEIGHRSSRNFLAMFRLPRAGGGEYTVRGLGFRGVTRLRLVIGAAEASWLCSACPGQGAGDLG